MNSSLGSVASAASPTLPPQSGPTGLGPPAQGPVGKAVDRVVAKAVESPLASLASAFGGGAQADHASGQTWLGVLAKIEVNQAVTSEESDLFFEEALRYGEVEGTKRAFDKGLRPTSDLFKKWVEAPYFSDQGREIFTLWVENQELTVHVRVECIANLMVKKLGRFKVFLQVNSTVLQAMVPIALARGYTLLLKILVETLSFRRPSFLWEMIDYASATQDRDFLKVLAYIAVKRQEIDGLSGRMRVAIEKKERMLVECCIDTFIEQRVLKIPFPDLASALAFLQSKADEGDTLGERNRARNLTDLVQKRLWLDELISAQDIDLLYQERAKQEVLYEESVIRSLKTSGENLLLDM